MPAFPTPHTVRVHVYLSSAVDAHGNPTATWDANGIDYPVYGWSPPSADTETLGGREAVTRALDLLVPPGFPAGPRDRVSVDGVLYDVVGYPEDFDHGPFRWTPGLRVNLRRTEG
jgi:hypothetical protein